MKILYKIIFVFSIISAFSYLAYSAQDTLKKRVYEALRVEEAQNMSENEEAENKASLEESDKYYFYEEGDWKKYSSKKEYYSTYKKNQNDFFIMFNAPLTVSYGKSDFTKDKYRLSDEDKPVSSYVNDGFLPMLKYSLIAQGYVDNSLWVNIDYDSERDSNINVYEIVYKAPNDNDFLRELRLGNIELDFNDSEFVRMDSQKYRADGISVLFENEKLKIKSFGVVNNSESEIEYFKGLSAKRNIKLRDYQYVRRKYYQIEPYKRYDNRTVAPDVSSETARNKLVVFTSSPETADPVISNEDYTLSPVNLTSGSVEVYLNNGLEMPEENSLCSADGNMYFKLQNGKDYSVNYITGELVFHRNIDAVDKVFVLYKTSGNWSSDPASINYEGKRLVFIQYSGLLNTDVDSDGSINYDIYEIKSVYSTGSGSIDSKVDIKLLKYNSAASITDLANAGKYYINTNRGTLHYTMREPFRSILKDPDKIYSQVRLENSYTYSEYALDLNYSMSGKKIKLKHMDLVQNSVEIKVNGVELDKSNFNVNCLLGEISFSDYFTGTVSNNAPIEVKYKYIPLSDKMIANTVTGARAEYKINEYLTTGASVIYSADNPVREIPNAGEEPQALLTGEIDSELKIGYKQFSSLLKPYTKNKKVPLRFRGYYEYARSYNIVNTFGESLIDDFDAAGRTIELDMSEKYWILSSPPGSYLQSERGLLNYKYYRDPSDNYNLKGEGFGFYSVNYSVKTGPYNINEKYFDNYDCSLVLDFDFNGEDKYSSIITQKLSDSSIDISDVQYVEIIYKAASGSGVVNLNMEAGRFNEDSDGDGNLDTEDLNSNMFLDVGISSSEDRGYLFNPPGELNTYIGSGPYVDISTKGDGVLSSEDVNFNGKLDLSEEFISFPSSIAFVEGNSAQTTLEVDLGDRSWKKTRIYLDRTNISSDDFANLSRVEAIRLWIESSTGSGTESGVIYINSVRVAGLSWSDIKINGVSGNNPERFQVNYVSSNNDSEYRSNAFIVQNLNDYEQLFGELNSEDNPIDIHEGALEIIYNSISSYADGVSTRKKFEKTLDMSNYGKLIYWINARSRTLGDVIEFEFGSDDNNYRIYSFEIPLNQGWNKFEVNLKNMSEYGVNYNQVGNPDLTTISYIRYRIKGDTGKIWINNLYLSDPKNISGQAFYTENTLNIDAPLLKGKSNARYFDKNEISYAYRYTDSGFNSLTHEQQGFDTQNHNVKYSVAPFTILLSDIQYIQGESIEKKETGYNSKYNDKSLITNHKIIPETKKYPNISLRYTQYFDEINNYEYIDSDLYKRNAKNKDFDIKIYINEDNLDIKDTEFQYYMSLETSYSLFKENYNFQSGVSSSGEGSYENAEQASIFAGGLLYKTDTIDTKIDFKLNDRIVSKYNGYSEYESNISEEINGTVYFPFAYSDYNYKYLERGVEFENDILWKFSKYAGIGYFAKLSNVENDFKDIFQENIELLGFKREKNGLINKEYKWLVPFYFNETKYKYIELLELSYRRKLSLSEQNIPYEGEGKALYKEEFGIRNSGKNIYEASYSYSKYYPFFFLFGNKNFLAGRDNVNDFMNSNLSKNNTIITDYNNSIDWEDEFNIENEVRFKGFETTFDFMLKNKAFRSAIDNVPEQSIFIDEQLLFTIEAYKLFGIPAKNKNELKLSLGYSNRNVLMITKNNYETAHSPMLNINYSEKMFSIGMDFSFDFIRNKNYSFIATDIVDQSDPNYIYSQNINEYDFKKHDYAYSFNLNYKQKIAFLKPYKDKVYKSRDYPEFLFITGFLINDYNYQNSVSPEPYNFYYIEGALSSNMSKFSSFKIFGKAGLEQYYNRSSGEKYKEIYSYETGFALTVFF